MNWRRERRWKRSCGKGQLHNTAEDAPREAEAARERISPLLRGIPPRPDGRTIEVRAHITSRLESAIASSRTTLNVIGGAVALILVIAALLFGLLPALRLSQVRINSVVTRSRDRSALRCRAAAARR